MNAGCVNPSAEPFVGSPRQPLPSGLVYRVEDQAIIESGIIATP